MATYYKWFMVGGCPQLVQVEVAMPKLEASKQVMVMKDGRPRFYDVDFAFASYEEMRKLAVNTATVVFQASMRGVRPMPSYVQKFTEVEE